MSPTFRLATSDDLASVLALLDDDRTGLTKPRLDAILARIQRYPDYHIWIVEDDIGPCATFTLVTIDRIAHGGAGVALLDALHAAGGDAGRLIDEILTFARELARQRGCSQLLLLGAPDGQVAAAAGRHGFSASALSLDPLEHRAAHGR